MRDEAKKFIARLAIFLAIFFVIFTALNKYANWTIRKNMKDFRKDEALDSYLSSKNNKKIVNGFFGDSHVHFAIDPKLIKDSYNLGLDGERHAETYCHLKNLLNRGIVIENIFLQVDFNIFENVQDNFEGLNFYYYSGCLPIKSFSTYRNENYMSTYVKSNYPIIGNGENFLTSQFRLYENSDDASLGWKRMSASDAVFNPDDKKQQVVIAEYRNHNFQMQPQSLSAILELVKLAKDNNMNVFFVKYPMHAEYMKAIEGRERPLYDKLFSEIEKTGLKNYHTLDYSRLFGDESKYFSDFTHLNYLGAETVSAAINNDLSK